MKQLTPPTLIFLGLLGLSFVLIGCSGSEGRQEKYLKKGYEHYEANNIEKAKVELKNVLQINPKNAEARLLQAKISKEEGEFRKAFAIYNGIIEEAPENIEANLELARIYYAGEQNERALQHLDTVLLQQPNHKDAQLIVAAIESRRGNIAQALSIVTSVLKQHPNDPEAVAVAASAEIQNNAESALARVNEALTANDDSLLLKKTKLQILTQLDQKADIEQHLAALTTDHPDLLEYHFLLARLLFSDNRKDDAERVLKNAVAVNPDAMEAKQAYIQFVIQQKGAEQAEKELLTLTNADRSNFELQSLLAKFYLDNNRKDDAVAVFKAVVKDSDHKGNTLLAKQSLATIAYHDGDIEQAKDYLAQIFEVEPNNTQALILSSKIALDKRDNKEAIASLRAALKNDSESIDALRLLAAAQEREREHQLALESYHRILELYPLDTQALLGAANINLNLNDTDRARVLLEQLVRVNEFNATAVSMLTRIYGEAKQWQKAERVVAPLLENDATRVSGLILQAEIERGKERWDRARDFYAQSLKLQPKALESVAGFTDSFIVQGEYTKAIDFLVGHIQKYPDLDYAKEMLAHVYLISGDTDLAVKQYTQLIQDSPRRITPYRKLTAIYTEQGKLDSAMQLLQKGLATHKNSVDFRLMLANLYTLNGKHQLSANLYEEVLAIDASNPMARNNYAVLLVNHLASDKNAQKALELVSPLSGSKLPAILDTMGWVHYKNGHLPQAISFLQAAIKQNPDNYEFRYHLGMALYKSGELEKAKEELSLATKAPEAYFGLEEAEETLKNI